MTQATQRVQHQTMRQRRRAGFRTIEKLGIGGSRSLASEQAKTIGELVKYFGGQQTFVRLTGFSLRSLANYKSGSRLVRHGNERRINELHRLKNALARIMKPDAVPLWLRRPNPVFQNLTPIEVIERGNIDQIWRLIHLGESNGIS